MFENKDESRTSLGELGEFGLINHLTQTFKIKQSSTVTAIGDDAADDPGVCIFPEIVVHSPSPLSPGGQPSGRKNFTKLLPLLSNRLDPT